MKKLKFLRKFHIMTVFNMTLLCLLLCFYIYDETEFVSLSEFITEVIFGIEANLADKIEAIWPPLILVSLLIFIIEETAYKKIYKKAIRNEGAHNMKKRITEKEVVVKDKKVKPERVRKVRIKKNKVEEPEVVETPAVVETTKVSETAPALTRLNDILHKK